MDLWAPMLTNELYHWLESRRTGQLDAGILLCSQSWEASLKKADKVGTHKAASDVRKAPRNKSWLNKFTPCDWQRFCFGAKSAPLHPDEPNPFSELHDLFQPADCVTLRNVLDLTVALVGKKIKIFGEIRRRSTAAGGFCRGWGLRGGLGGLKQNKHIVCCLRLSPSPTEDDDPPQLWRRKT